MSVLSVREAKHRVRTEGDEEIFVRIQQMLHGTTMNYATYFFSKLSVWDPMFERSN